MPDSPTHKEIVANQILRYITMDETMSAVSSFRETLFQPGPDHKMLLHSHGLDTKILLDSIGYSSIPFNWANARSREGKALSDVETMWAELVEHFHQDSYAREQTNGMVPERLSRTQILSVMEIVDKFESNLRSLYLSSRLHLMVFGVPPTPYYTNARMGYGGYSDVRISPLFEIITDKANPHPHWSALHTAQEMQYFVAVVPDVFQVPMERWMRVRELRFIVNMPLDPREPLEYLDELRRKPVGEFLALLIGSAKRPTDVPEALEQIPSFLTR